MQLNPWLSWLLTLCNNIFQHKELLYHLTWVVVIVKAGRLIDTRLSDQVLTTLTFHARRRICWRIYRRSQIRWLSKFSRRLGNIKRHPKWKQENKKIKKNPLASSPNAYCYGPQKTTFREKHAQETSNSTKEILDKSKFRITNLWHTTSCSANLVTASDFKISLTGWAKLFS